MYYQSGDFAAVIALDMTFVGYFRDIREALIYSDVIGGIIKAVIFGFLVIPRVFAVIAAMPILIIIADLMGVLG